MITHCDVCGGLGVRVETRPHGLDVRACENGHMWVTTLVAHGPLETAWQEYMAIQPNDSHRSKTPTPDFIAGWNARGEHPYLLIWFATQDEHARTPNELLNDFLTWCDENM
jgi:hypothetical protein